MSVEDTFTPKLQSLARQIKEDVRVALREEAADIVQAAQQIVPVVTGELKQSGGVVETEDGAAAEFIADYAVDVHENPNSEGFRFLERAADERSSGLPDRVAEKAKVDP